MNPYLVGVLMVVAAILLGAVVAASVVYRRVVGRPDPRHPSQLRGCRICWATGDCTICIGDGCDHCFGGACPSCGGTGVDLEAEAA